MKNTKNLIWIALAVVFINAGILSPVLAEERNEKRFEGQKMEEAKEKRVTLKKENALREIDRRIASLTKLIEKIRSVKGITEAQKTKLADQVQVEIAKLKSLRVAIESDTDLVTLTEHKKSIVDSYRIYALFLPKINIIAHGDRIIEVADLMKVKTTNSEALAKIESGRKKSQEAINLVIDLLPADYPTNKANLEKARGLLKEAIKELNLARPLLAK